MCTATYVDQLSWSKGESPPCVLTDRLAEVTGT